MVKVTKEVKKSSFEKWMVFLVILSLFVFVQGAVIRSTISYNHVVDTFQEKAYSACARDGMDRTECNQEAIKSYGKSIDEFSGELFKPFYYGDQEIPGFVGIIHRWIGSWFGSWWLVITLIAGAALILKLRKNTKGLFEKMIKILKIEGILLLIGGCIFYVLFILSLAPFFGAVGSVGGYEGAQMGMGFVVAILSPLAYQIITSIIILVLVFVTKKYRA